ncbi:hypothetical protein MnTg02_02742 [bacterium MnTg02]|nr:hypothetical protein MnTg02_02742 [bacterium MnTg02]
MFCVQRKDRGPTRWPCRLMRRLKRDCSGASMVEFSLIAGLFLFLIFAVLDIALIYWANFELENATNDAARLIRTGQVQKDPPMGAATFKSQICAKTAILWDCSGKLQVNVEGFNTFADVAPVDPFDAAGELKQSFAFQPGGGEDIVLVTTFYEWQPFGFFPGLALSNMSNGNLLLRAALTFRNEPFETEN